MFFCFFWSAIGCDVIKREKKDHSGWGLEIGQPMEWFGFCVFSPDGSLMRQCAVSCYSSTPLQAELMAILLAVTWSLPQNFNVAFIFIDCLNAINLQLAERSDSHYVDRFLLHDLRQEISKFVFCRISKVDRKVIYSAHCGRWCHLLPLQLQGGTPFWSRAITDLQTLFL